MLVVSDTTPLNYLILTGQQNILPQLFGRVLIPRAVLEELQREKAPAAVKAWIANRPAWLEVRDVQAVAHPEPDALDAGEREAIQLALSTQADFLLIDEREGRAQGQALNLTVIGTLGVLDKAAAKNLIVLSDVIERLRQTSFRLPEAVVQKMLERYERK